MTEPTFKQHKILEKISVTDGIYRKGDEQDIEEIWVLVRAGYVRNLVNMGGQYDWKFILTDKGDKYLSEMAEQNGA